MTTPGPPNTSSTARLVLGELGYQVGWQQPIYGAVPAAAAGFSHTVDGRYFERLLSVTFHLATDATVGNRFPLLRLLDSNNTLVAAVPVGSGVAPSTTETAFLTINGPAYDQGAVGFTFGFLPDLLIPPGWSWTIAAGDLVGADQLTAIVLLVQQFPNDATTITAGG